MSCNLSACVFIKDCFTGAFCLFESMASLLPFCDEFLVMDLGSTDGTREALNEIAMTNPKVRLIPGEFPSTNALAFAKLANDLIRLCSNDRVLYYQADEIWHPDLLRIMKAKFDEGNFDLSFWRIQYANNFQYVKWFPHIVHRVGIRTDGKFYFAETAEEQAVNKDGMNSTRFMDASLCSTYGGDYFLRWGTMGQDGIKPYVHEMIMDVSLLGGFRDNIIERRTKHAPFWGEQPTSTPYFDRHSHRQNHIDTAKWVERAMNDEDWTKTESPYNLPPIMHYHIGKPRYELRPELLEALRTNTTEAMVGL